VKIDLIFPRLPPSLDGIGDYTSHLARSLAQQGAAVRVLTAQAATVLVPSVVVERSFSIVPPQGVRELLTAVRAAPPDWVILQYNPFSYGHWGFNPWLPEVLARLKREHHSLRIAVTVHEPFVPTTNWKFALMTMWQRWQLWRLGNVADLVFCSIEVWAERFQCWFPQTPVRHLPIGSNIPVRSCVR
jgi:glycosyltransferase involved in cell wall biosynthesis